MGSMNLKAKNLSASGSITPAGMKRLRGFTVTPFNSAVSPGTQVKFSDTLSATDYFFAHDIAGTFPYAVDIPDEGIRFPAGLSVLVPTSVAVLIFYDGG